MRAAEGFGWGSWLWDFPILCHLGGLHEHEPQAPRHTWTLLKPCSLSPKPGSLLGKPDLLIPLNPNMEPCQFGGAAYEHAETSDPKHEAKHRNRIISNVIPQR